GYAVIARPLSTLLRKDEVFRFAEEQQLAFGQLQSALTKAPEFNYITQKQKQRSILTLVSM
ncbi:unnamed protein product, partial [Ceratitis capitata]